MPSNTENAHRITKCGTVAIIGRPNVGKSTLLNALLGEKISIVSDVPQTTRQQIRGIYTDERGQIIFIDTPGFHVGRDSLDKYMNRASRGAMGGVDLIIHLVDANDRIGQEERQVIGQLKDCGKTIIVGFNKVDLSKGKYIPDYIQLWQDMRGKPVGEMPDLILFPLSALKGTNVDKLIGVLFEHLSEGPLLYPQDVITDLPQRMAMADMIREKFFLKMREEVPHSLAVVIEHVAPRRGKTLHIRAVILVERDSQKEIVIGKGGAVLKEAGTAARKDLEELIGGKVFLELFVKIQNNWRQDQSILEEMGYVV
ncbi:MAG: GTPase Era [Candidatus Omnitrophica bacterium]|nr:GTPase Era [Candidatus Omnitrophota bacterium]